MAALGDDPERWEPAAIRGFFLDRASHCGNGTVEKLTTSLRAFLRYLAVEGRCRAGLADVVPGYAHWRLADLPRYLAAEQVNRLIAACDGEVVAHRRDRAIVLLLARLGLRAGDVAQLRLDDIEWEMGSLRVSGKSRYEVRLPLPQRPQDAALAAYLLGSGDRSPDRGRPSATTQRRVALTDLCDIDRTALGHRVEDLRSAEVDGRRRDVRRPADPRDQVPENPPGAAARHGSSGLEALSGASPAPFRS